MWAGRLLMPPVFLAPLEARLENGGRPLGPSRVQVGVRVQEPIRLGWAQPWPYPGLEGVAGCGQGRSVRVWRSLLAAW